MIAEILGMLQRAQIDRHGGTNLNVFRIFTAAAQIVIQCAGGRGDQHIVDRTAQSPAHRLDFIQRQRLGPGHALARAQTALEPGWRIVTEQQRGGQFVSDVDGFCGIGTDLFRLTQYTQHFFQCFLAPVHRSIQAIAGGFQKATKDVGLLHALAFPVLR